MMNSINEWQQSGHVYLWRYGKPLSKNRRGWHFTADTAGASSLVDLLERMKAVGVPCHRTISLSAITPEIWAVPNFGSPKPDRFERLRIDYEPDEAEATLMEAEGRLDMKIGADRAAMLAAAFVEVSAGLGDFGMATSRDKHADTWMFWWMQVPKRH